MKHLLGKRAARQNVFHFAGAMRKTVGLSHECKGGAK